MLGSRGRVGPPVVDRFKIPDNASALPSPLTGKQRILSLSLPLPFTDRTSMQPIPQHTINQVCQPPNLVCEKYLDLFSVIDGQFGIHTGTAAVQLFGCILQN